MPKLDSPAVKHRMAELGVTSEELSTRTGIPWGSLRNAIAGRDPLTLDRVYDVARALIIKADAGRDLRAVVCEILVSEDGVPDNPPDQTKPKEKPERRKEKGGSGPKRESERGAA
jgi:hypothetical protein